MINIKDNDYQPNILEISNYIRNNLFNVFCLQIKELYHVEPKIEFSKCSWEKGWNLKFKKSNKSLCTLYPRENYFTLLIVIGLQEKSAVEKRLSSFSPIIQNIYKITKEGNGQR